MVTRSMTMPTACRCRPYCIISRHRMPITLISSCLSSVRNWLKPLDEKDNLARLILKLYDDYAHSITNHMKYEEKMVFPYVQALIDGNANANFDIETFSKHHVQVDMKLKELKSIIIKYLPSDGLHNNQLSATLYDIYNNEEWLKHHSEVEEEIFIPAVRNAERKLKQNDVSAKISSMINPDSEE